MPGLFELPMIAERDAKDAFPEATGHKDKQDALRHILGAGLVSQKYGRGLALGLGAVNEVLSPSGISDLSMDLFNNRIGAELGQRTKSYEELYKEAVRRVNASRPQPIGLRKALVGGDLSQDMPVTLKPTVINDPMKELEATFARNRAREDAILAE